MTTTNNFDESGSVTTLPFKDEDKNETKKKSKFSIEDKNNEITKQNENKEINSERIQIDKKDDKIEESIGIERAPIKDDKKEDDKDEGNKKDEEPKKKTVCQYIKEVSNEIFIEGFGGMAQGLFCTLIAGTMIIQIGRWCGEKKYFGKLLVTFGSIAKQLMGASIGVGIAVKFKAEPLIIFSSCVCGSIGAFGNTMVDVLIKNKDYTWAYAVPGNPVGSYICSIISIKIVKLYVGKTKLDIVLVPLGMMLISVASIFIGWPFIRLIDLFGEGIEKAIESGTGAKYIVCIFVSVIVGLLLTLPTSSAAIWIAIGATQGGKEPYKIASAAACCGGASHTVGFAFASFRENGFSGLISQGLGTSMLQIPNLMKKPIILIPPVIASLFVGPISVALDLRCNIEGGGMATSGLIGVFGILDASQGVIKTWKIALGIIFGLFIVPAVVSLGVSEFMRKRNWIKFGYMKLEN